MSVFIYENSGWHLFFADPKASVTFALFKLLLFFLYYRISQPHGTVELILSMGNQGREKSVLCPGSPKLMWERLGSQTFMLWSLSPFALPESMEDPPDKDSSFPYGKWHFNLSFLLVWMQWASGRSSAGACQQLVCGGKTGSFGPEWNQEH